MRLKPSWIVGASLCLLSIAGFFFVLSVGNRASLGGSKILSEMLHVQKLEELGPAVSVSPQASVRQEEKSLSPSRTLKDIDPTPEEIKRMEKEGVVFN
jgi:hypothetical protein